jgi:hypothetical protein
MAEVRGGMRHGVVTSRKAMPAVIVAAVLLISAVAGCISVGGASLPGSQAVRDAAGSPGSAGNTASPAPGATTAPPKAGGKQGSAGEGRVKFPSGPFFGAQLAGIAPLGPDVRQDEGASIALPDGRILYIFADTLRQSTKPTFFVSSAAAITDPSAPLRLQYSVNGSGTPAEFLPREPDESKDQADGVSYTAVWPTGATTLPDNRIIISYAKYDIVLRPLKMTFRGAGLYEYRYDGAQRFLAGGASRRIADDIWTPETGPVGAPVYHGGHVYFTMCEDLECYSLRTTPDALSSPSSYRWWNGSGWSSSQSDRRRMLFGASRPGNSPSIVWVPSVEAFVMADTEAGHQGQFGLLWVAENPWGPWSVPATLGFPRCPEAGCYGLNVHPGQSTANSLRISYSPVGRNKQGPYVYLVDQPVDVSSSGRRIRTPGD